MNQKDLAITETNSQPDELTHLIIDAIQDVKGQDIRLFDMRGIDNASSDYFIICHAQSVTQINGILGNIEKKVFQQLGLRPNHTEGRHGKSWMLIDYFNVIVHVFDKEKRSFYNLEELWNDATVTAHDVL